MTRATSRTLPVTTVCTTPSRSATACSAAAAPLPYLAPPQQMNLGQGGGEPLEIIPAGRQAVQPGGLPEDHRLGEAVDPGLLPHDHPGHPLERLRRQLKTDARMSISV
ncbi:hypothetical protein ABZ470_36745 [Streptosporangium sp. NPDC020072]|uniref:hypothetical protein n=1 Tax=Streptosporangium sp. NPDC020072 TaxID=3154788 RepID=UPI00341D0908